MNFSRNETWLIDSPADISLEIPAWKRLLDVTCILVLSPIIVIQAQ